jgi:hypothetical protein
MLHTRSMTKWKRVQGWQRYTSFTEGGRCGTSWMGGGEEEICLGVCRMPTSLPWEDDHCILIDSVWGEIMESLWLTGRCHGTVACEGDATFDPRYRNFGWEPLEFGIDASEDREDLSRDGRKVTR